MGCETGLNEIEVCKSIYGICEESTSRHTRTVLLYLRVGRAGGGGGVRVGEWIDSTLFTREIDTSDRGCDLQFALRG